MSDITAELWAQSLRNLVPFLTKARNFSFLRKAQNDLGPTQNPIQWVPEALFYGLERPVREANLSPSASAGVKNELCYTSSNSYAFVTLQLYLIHTYVHTYICMCMFLQTQQSHSPCVTLLRQAFTALKCNEYKAVDTVHTCLFRYSIICYNNSILFIYLLAK